MWYWKRSGRYQDSVRELEKAAADKQPDPEILGHLGDAYLRAGQPEQAKKTWQRAAEAFRKSKDLAKLKEMETRIATGK